MLVGMLVGNEGGCVGGYEGGCVGGYEGGYVGGCVGGYVGGCEVVNCTCICLSMSCIVFLNIP